MPPGDMPSRIEAACRLNGTAVPESPPALVRCILDSLAQAFARTLREAERIAARKVAVVHIVGGGARNTLLCQLTANACGLPVLAGPVEATAIGNIVIQARAHGLLTGSLEDIRALILRTQEVSSIRARSFAIAGPLTMRVALFVTCYNDLLFPEVGQATVKILTRLGQEVEFPVGQTCCGQIHFNTGYRDECVPLVENFTRTFEGYDAVVTPSPSCAAMVRHNYSTVAQHAARKTGDHDLAARVESVAPKVYELTEFLVDVLGTVDVGARFAERVTYHPTCHGRRMLGIGDRPIRLLQAVDGPGP